MKVSLSIASNTDMGIYALKFLKIGQELVGEFVRSGIVSGKVWEGGKFDGVRDKAFKNRAARALRRSAHADGIAIASPSFNKLDCRSLQRRTEKSKQEHGEKAAVAHFRQA